MLLINGIHNKWLLDWIVRWMIQIIIIQMGSNSSAQKVSLEEKIQCLEKILVKSCVYHNKQAILYCSIPSCRKSPYLCQECLNQKVHAHSEGIHDHNNFIKAMATLVQLKREKENKVLENSLAKPSKDYSWVLKEEMKLMEHVESLQTQIFKMFQTFKKKLQSQINRNMKKANRQGKQKSESFYRFYSNPNILVNKLLSEQTDEFILDLKEKLDISSNSEKHIMISGDEEISTLKTELTNTKNYIRELLNVSHNNFFIKKKSLPNLLSAPVLLDRKKLQLLDYPKMITTFSGKIYASTSREVFSIDCYTKEKTKIYSQGLQGISGVSESENGEFIAILNPTSLLLFDGRSFQKINLLARVSTARILKTRKTLYGVLGEDEGVLNVIDLSQNKSVFHYRCGDKSVNHIQICEKNSTVYAATLNGSLYAFKYQLKFEELNFQFSMQMPPEIYPGGALQLMRIRNHDLILMGPSRNIVVLDLILNTVILKTQYQNKCPPFTHCTFISYEGSELMLTLNENETSIYGWAIDKLKRTVKVDPVEVSGKQSSILGIEGSSLGELWVIKDGSKEILVTGVDMQ